MGPPVSPRRIARFGIFEVDLESRRLTKGGLRVRLQEQPFHVLSLLLARPGEVVTREELKEKLWPGDTYVEFDTGLNTAVRKLRSALGEVADNPRFIETLPRIGYRFLATPSFTPELDQVVNSENGAASPENQPDDLAMAGDPSSPSVATTSSLTSSRHMGLFALVAVAVLFALVAVLFRGHLKRPEQSAQPVVIDSLAVLPLQNMSPGAGQDFFAEGITDELITDLAKLAGPKVISRTSTSQYAGTHKTMPEIARELHVGAIVEGSVQHVGEKVHVRIQLIQASTDQHLWAETYDRQTSDVLTLEGELARDIATQIRLHLTPQQQEAIAPRRSRNPQAFQDFLQGRHYWALRTDDGLKKAVEYFTRAVQEDPADASSYAGLAQCYIVMGALTKMSNPEAYAKVQAFASKASSLDDSLPEAHLSLAEMKLYQDWDFSGAEKEFKRTLELNPNYSTAHQWYGEFLSLMARHDEAIRELQTAVSLDPLSAIVHLQFANALREARQNERALAEYAEAVKTGPAFSSIYEAKYWVLRRQGKFLESAQAYADSAAPGTEAYNKFWAKNLSDGYSTGGKSAYLQQCLRFHEKYFRPSYYVARDYADLGETDAAFASLDRAYKNHDQEILWLLDDPEFDPMRADPRFQQLLHKIGFTRRSGAVAAR